MPTATKTEEPEKLEVSVPNAEASPVYKDSVRWDHKLFWLVISAGILYLTSRQGNDLKLVILMSLALAGLNGILFWMPLFNNFTTTLSVWLYGTGRYAWREFRNKNLSKSEEVALGKVAVLEPSPDLSREVRIPIPEMKRAFLSRRVALPGDIGKVIFFPTNVNKKQPMGVVWNPATKSWVFTASTKWYPWDPSFISFQRSRLAALGRLCDMFALSTNSLARLVLQDETIIGERVNYDRDVQPFVKNRRERSGAKDNSSDDRYLKNVVADLGDKTVWHESTITVALKGRRGTAAQAPIEVIKSYEDFVRTALGREIGLQSMRVFSHNQLVYAFLSKLDPVFVSRNWRLLEKWVEQKELLDPGILVPPTDKAHLHSHRVGETYHSSWLVDEWGRKGKVAPNALWSVVGEPVAKTVTTIIHVEPLNWAKKAVTMSTTAVRGRNVQKMQSGATPNEFDLVDLEERVEAERALARGHGMRSTSLTYVTFTGPTEEEARTNADAVAAVASNEDILLRPLTGDQSMGLAASVPLALGLAGGKYAQRAATLLRA